ncbi:MAG: BREX system Lon protease-like protein BrxL [Candidatus Fusobacterium pullicola]|uniref:BREX system Lon protease-like protein BrxL n=1 Tax=Candidatus Fusobacterium pullicola TaxID=2838601 RepID=A0A9E2KXR8_9FUSO|nr:BREX system Lon protease-like protein BrxL [Candidatus Fusobacterium pullicola]
MTTLSDNIIKETIEKMDGKAFKEIVLKLMEREEKKENLPYEIVDLAKNKPSFPIFISSIEKKLRYDDEMVSSNNSFEAFINTDTYTKEYGITLKIKDSNLDLFLPLPDKIKKEFYLNIKTGTYTCEGEIRYTPELDVFTVHYLKIYAYQDIFNIWSNLISNTDRAVRSRIDFLLSKFGLEPNNLLYIEKIVFLLRLVPLVEKKYLMVDISKREIGKSHVYSMLDFNLYTNCVTRSTAFIDGRNGKEGDFFSEDIAYIIDEIGKVNDPEVITSVQVYKNGDKNEGTIQAGKGNKKSSNSIILLGNPKIIVDFNRIFKDRINIFSNTIIDKNEDSTAFLSRIDSLLPSYGCRTFDSLMLNKNGKDEKFIDIFKNVLPVLREKEINISELLKKFDLPLSFNSSREENAIFKTLEGLLKILYPEVYIENNNLSQKILNFLVVIAIQTRQTVNNQIAIIEKRELGNISFYPYNIKNVYFNLEGSYVYTPHRIFINEGTAIRKIPLDTVGIEINKLEINYLKQMNYQFEEMGIGELRHSLNITNNFEKSNLMFNYLTGNIEKSGQYNIIKSYSLINF